MPMMIQLEVVADYVLYSNHVPAQTKWRFRPFWFGGAPKLQNMILEGMPPDHIDARFTSLRVLDILDMDIPIERASVITLKVHRILSRLSHLQSLRLRSSRFYIRSMDRNDTQSLDSHITSPLSHGSLIELSLNVPPRVRNAIISSLALSELRYFVDRTRSDSDEWEIGLGICCLPVIGNTRPFPNLISIRLVGNSTPFFPRDRGSASEPKDPRNSSNLRHLPGALEGLKVLRSLTLNYVDLEHEGQLNCLSTACPELQWLSLVCCTGFTISELQSIAEKRKELRRSDSLLRLAVYGMPENWGAPSEREARLWLTREWNGEFVFESEGRREKPGGTTYIVHRD